MRAVRLQFKILCSRIDRHTNRSCKNIDSFTNVYTDDIEPIGIIPRVEKKLQHFATITDGYTDGMVPVGILQRVE
jgi:hypothetical protein